MATGVACQQKLLPLLGETTYHRPPIAAAANRHCIITIYAAKSKDSSI